MPGHKYLFTKKVWENYFYLWYLFYNHTHVAKHFYKVYLNHLYKGISGVSGAFHNRRIALLHVGGEDTAHGRLPRLVSPNRRQFEAPGISDDRIFLVFSCSFYEQN